MVSIVIPAHNEEQVIVRCLEALNDGASPGELDIIVVCNGCSDRTAQYASSFGRGVRVLETAEASKSAALNLGDRAATGFPRLYMDADVVFPYEGVKALAEQIARGAVMASPRGALDLDGVTFAVRGYYELWRRRTATGTEPVGSGVIALSESGRARLGDFPNVIADDTFVRTQFSPSERATLTAYASHVRPARTLRDIIRRRTRVHLGNRQLEQLALVRHPLTSRAWRTVLGQRPSLLLHMPTYVAVEALARWGARRQLRDGTFSHWGRDESSRRA